MVRLVKSAFFAFARERVFPAIAFSAVWFIHQVVLLVKRFCILAVVIVKLISLAMVFLVVASCPQSCHNIGRCFGGVVLPAVVSASPQKHFSRLLVVSASHAV